MLGAGCSATSKDIVGEVSVEGSGCIIYELTKARGGEVTLAQSRLSLLGRARDGLELDIAARAIMRGCWFGLVDNRSISWPNKFYE